jgi:hypothetical protein
MEDEKLWQEYEAEEADEEGDGEDEEGDEEHEWWWMEETDA